MGRMIWRNMKNVQFVGIKSRIEFDENQDPIITVNIRRVQGERDTAHSACCVCNAIFSITNRLERDKKYTSISVWWAFELKC